MENFWNKAVEWLSNICQQMGITSWVKTNFDFDITPTSLRLAYNEYKNATTPQQTAGGAAPAAAPAAAPGTTPAPPAAPAATASAAPTGTPTQGGLAGAPKLTGNFNKTMPPLAVPAGASAKPPANTPRNG